MRRVRGGSFFFKFYCHLLHARIGEELFLVNKTQASESWGSVGGSDLANHSSLSLFFYIKITPDIIGNYLRNFMIEDSS